MSTFSFVFARTDGWLLIAFEAVATETPAARATSTMVLRRAPALDLVVPSNVLAVFSRKQRDASAPIG